MSRSFANSLGVAALAILAILIVNDVQSLFHSAATFPRVVQALMIVMIAILANCYFTYLIIRGRPLEPSFSEEKLREMMADAARKVLREEFETLAGQILVRDIQGTSTPEPQRAMPKPYVVRSNEN
jgi:Na+/melibiose symporter-like transporter